MKSPLRLAPLRALIARVSSFLDRAESANRPTPVPHRVHTRKAARSSAAHRRAAAQPAPSAPFPANHLWRIAMVVLATFAITGALHAAPPSNGIANAGLTDTLKDFFTRLWSPSTGDAEKLGTAYMYDEQGNLLSEMGTGGASSSGSTQYIYLPTANGSMPVAAVMDGQIYAVQSDHLHTPRRLTNAQGQPVWQWAYSALGENKPTTAANRFAEPGLSPQVAGTTGLVSPDFNLAYQGMYRATESGLLYNGFRSYCPDCGGRYTQADPIGLNGGSNRFVYVDGNPLSYVDPDGLQQKGLPRRPQDLIPLDAGGGSGIGGGGGSASRWSPPCPPAGAGTRAFTEPVYKTTKEAQKAAEALGFRRINETIHDGQAVFRRGKDFITRDMDGHNGGAWKMADSVKNLGSKETRAGTFDINLKRIGD